MARFQFVMSREDHDAYFRLARRAGLSFSAWLREAARRHAAREQAGARFASAEGVEQFFSEHNALVGQIPEPDWKVQKALIGPGSDRWMDSG